MQTQDGKQWKFLKDAYPSRLSSLFPTRPTQRAFTVVSLTFLQIVDLFDILISVVHSVLEVVLLKFI